MSKVIRVTKNVVVKIPVRKLRLKLACGHIQPVTLMSATMSVPRFMKCLKCTRGY